jgi:hypothetical protein
MTKIDILGQVVLSCWGMVRFHTLCLIIGLFLALAPQAQAGFVGYYDLNNWTLTNTDLWSGAGTNGSAFSPDGGLSVELAGGYSGSGLPGTTELVIQAAGGGLVQFRYSYYSDDIPGPGNPGCGALTDPCDLAGYLFNGTFTWLADDVKQQSGIASFAVNAGDSFGFRMQTLDNTGTGWPPYSLTISDFSAPVPEPLTAPLTVMAIAFMVIAKLARRPDPR